MMTDIFSKEKRSWVMSRIRGTNTKIDLRMRDMLEENKIRYEMYPKMFGNPDFILKRKKIAIFCDGDFWHGYNYMKKNKKPSKRYWIDKIETNMARDRRISQKLRRDGWSVLRFWEHDIQKKPETCIRKIKRKMKEST